MTIYLEDAFLFNFLLDLMLLLLTLRGLRAPVRMPRLIAASLTGAAEAIAFSCFRLPVAAAIPVKALGGMAMAAIAVASHDMRSWLKAGGLLFCWTFLLGGTLTALYNAADFAKQGGGSLAFVMGGTVLFALVALLCIGRLLRAVRLQQCGAQCRLSAGGRTCRLQGIWDSGNTLYFRGEPVSVVSPLTIFALFGSHPVCVGQLQIGTVNGTRSAPVFVCPTVQVEGATLKDIYLTTGDLGRDIGIILHTSFMREVEHGHACKIKGMAEADGGVRKRGALSERRGGFAAAAFPRGGDGDAASPGAGGGDGRDQKPSDHT